MFVPKPSQSSIIFNGFKDWNYDNRKFIPSLFKVTPPLGFDSNPTGNGSTNRRAQNGEKRLPDSLWNRKCIGEGWMIVIRIVALFIGVPLGVLIGCGLANRNK